MLSLLVSRKVYHLNISLSLPHKRSRSASFICTEPGVKSSHFLNSLIKSDSMSFLFPKRERLVTVIEERGRTSRCLSRFLSAQPLELCSLAEQQHKNKKTQQIVVVKCFSFHCYCIICSPILLCCMLSCIVIFMVLTSTKTGNWSQVIQSV